MRGRDFEHGSPDSADAIVQLQPRVSHSVWKSAVLNIYCVHFRLINGAVEAKDLGTIKSRCMLSSDDIRDYILRV